MKRATYHVQRTYPSLLRQKWKCPCLESYRPGEYTDTGKTWKRPEQRNSIDKQWRMKMYDEIHKGYKTKRRSMVCNWEKEKKIVWQAQRVTEAREKLRHGILKTGRRVIIICHPYWSKWGCTHFVLYMKLTSALHSRKWHGLLVIYLCEDHEWILQVRENFEI